MTFSKAKAPRGFPEEHFPRRTDQKGRDSLEGVMVAPLRHCA